MSEVNDSVEIARKKAKTGINKYTKDVDTGEPDPIASAD
ncbi:protein of unknown function [Candidatus Nitrosocosmicus franklandus]|uniref:Uncharacterized protein n=1 Tax=Candidatus Nitrosocosmicus franklandianus TaxID=1798806 RepID=A0A484IED9_9ARCH|nr:protein of unknown function [Candidatus Nitrosocosmicus franklandus]